MKARVLNRGFTLIELMVSVAIIGILASTAVTNFKVMSLRARKAERDTMMAGLVAAAQDYLQSNDFKVAGGSLTGAWNPALPATTGKRQMNWGLAGWKSLPISSYGNTYYSYYFHFSTNPQPIYFIVEAEGDLDGDGKPNIRLEQFNLQKGMWVKVTDTESGGQF